MLKSLEEETPLNAEEARAFEFYRQAAAIGELDLTDPEKIQHAALTQTHLLRCAHYALVASRPQPQAI